MGCTTPRLPFEYVLIEVAKPAPQEEPAVLGCGVPVKDWQERLSLLVRQSAPRQSPLCSGGKIVSRSMRACGTRPLRLAVSV